MSRIGIIAEFNPFHNGHEHLIKYAKKHFDNSPVIIAMSGDFVQSGEPAITDKYKRARMATECGADLIIKLPVCASTASAQYFAESGVALLAKAGVDTLLFGCETPDPGLFLIFAKLLSDETEEYKAGLSANLRDGLSFPSARARALADFILKHPEYENDTSAGTISDFLSSPNNILGIEYTMAILRSGYDMTIHPVQRIASDHNDSSPVFEDADYVDENNISEGGNIVSATQIRGYISRINAGRSDSDISADLDKLFSIMPGAAAEILTERLRENEYVLPGDFDLLLHDRLLKCDNFSVFSDCSEDLSNKIKNRLDDYRSISSFADELKSKDITHSRITRVLSHILLDIRREDIDLLKKTGYAPYIHVLSANESGKSLFSDIKENTGCPLFMSVNELREKGNFKADVSPEIRRLLELDIYAAHLYRAAMISRCGHSLPTEYTKKICNCLA